MSINVSRLRAASIVKESILGTPQIAGNIAIVTGVNDAIDFTISATQYHAVITQGVYAIAALETAIAMAMNTAHSNTFVVALSTGKIQISGSGAFVLNWLTGTNTATSAGLTLGYVVTADSGSATSQTAPNAYIYIIPRYLNIVPPDSFTPTIDPLPSKGIEAIADMYPKITQGPGSLKSMKAKLELEPENCGEILEGTFGADTLAEVASFVIASGVNDAIDFKEDSGTQLHATIAAGTYAMGASSAVNGSLCKAIKTALEAAASATGTYTVTYSYTTNKVTIAPASVVTNIQILWLTGTNQATAAYSVLGWTHVDTANAASVTSNSTTATPPFSHTFYRQQVSQLPTFTWWFDKKPTYQLIAGSMLNKLTLEMKAKDIIMLDTEWEGIVYNDNGVAESTSFSRLRPFVWANAVVNVDSAQVKGYDNFKLEINNMVKADHALNNSIWPYVIYSEGFDVQISAELFFENTTQYEKFLAGTTAAFQVILTSGQAISGTSPAQYYSLTINIPLVFYKSAPLYIPGNGPLKIPFAGLAEVNYDGSPVNTLGLVLVNSIPTAY